MAKEHLTRIIKKLGNAKEYLDGAAEYAREAGDNRGADDIGKLGKSVEEKKENFERLIEKGN